MMEEQFKDSQRQQHPNGAGPSLKRDTTDAALTESTKNEIPGFKKKKGRAP